MPSLSAIIADDEKELRTYLKARLAEVWPDLKIVGEAGNGDDALAMIESLWPDMAFLDIRMPGLSGMEVARRIAGRCRVVFITAYDQYAVEAFENEAIDYLLKPITRERLDVTARRLKDRISDASEPPPNLADILEHLISAQTGAKTPEYLQWIRAQHGDGVRLIPVNEVCYFKAGDKYTRVITTSGESLIKKPIKELTDQLDPKKFWRIHRSTIVNVIYIDKVSRSLTGRYILRLKSPPETLTVSRTYAHFFRQM